jgi:glucose/arabinose dehydrogenase
MRTTAGYPRQRVGRRTTDSGPVVRRLSSVVLLVLLLSPRPAAAQAALDFEVANGHFFTQTDGQGGRTGRGYLVSNDEGVPFWDTFRRLGLETLGYPVGERFEWNGFTVQPFQKVVLQWRPELGVVQFVNIYDELTARGLDSWLFVNKGVPPPADWSADRGLPYDQVVARHLALLDADADLKAAYLAPRDFLQVNGLPVAPIQRLGDALVLRAQRKVFQKWLVDTPFAAAGQVVVANSGDVAKDAGLFPPAATSPRPPPGEPATRAVGSAAPGQLVDAGQGIGTPPGFRVTRFAEGLRQPTRMVFGPDGRLFVAEAGGAIMAIRGQGAAPVAYAAGFRSPLGLAWRGNDLYVSSLGKISLVRGPGVSPEDLVTGLPNDRHQNGAAVFGPDGRLYVGIGSTCDACEEKDPRSATIMSFTAAGGDGLVVARGLRNPYGLAFHPETGELYATDNGRDDRGDQVPDELNLIRAGAHYGWPGCYGAGRGEKCADTAPPLVELEPHASADGLTFYTGGTFPVDFRLNAFIAEWGANAGSAGRKVVRVVLRRDAGAPQGVSGAAQDFAAGFDRPIDVAVAPDGSLLVADYGRGVIYRIQWTGL